MAEGKVLKFMGHEIEVRPDDECARECDFMLCANKTAYDANPDAYVPGTKGGYFCVGCNTELVLAPSGQVMREMRKQHGREDLLLCIACVLKKAKEEEGGEN